MADVFTNKVARQMASGRGRSMPPRRQGAALEASGFIGAQPNILSASRGVRDDQQNRTSLLATGSGPAYHHREQLQGWQAKERVENRDSRRGALSVIQRGLI